MCAATCLVTSLGSGTTAEVARLEPDMRIARWNKELPWLTCEEKVRVTFVLEDKQS